jgi:hypothetical protein
LKGDAGRDGRDGKDGSQGERGLPGPQGAPGKLPKVRAWAEGVSYEGDVRTYQGGLFQAACDTSKSPWDEKDWVCLAAAGTNGEDGADGRSLTIKGTYNATEKYHALDVVTLDHTWHVAKKDNPSACPGPDWKAGPGIGRTGKPGDRGERGLPGKEGPAGREVIAWDIDRKAYLVTPIMSDGEKGSTLSVRELFDQFQIETR